jgi:hypothetical protein
MREVRGAAETKFALPRLISFGERAQMHPAV